MQGHFEITVNGTRHPVAREAVARPLLSWLREDLGLIGTKAGTCVGAACTGACTVCVLDWDGRGRSVYRAVSACCLTLPMAATREFVTVEALGAGREAHPVRRALAAAGAGGCGFCAGGLAMALFEIYYRQGPQTVEDARDALSNHTCRCGAARAALAAALVLVREAQELRQHSRRQGRIERARRRRKNAPRIQGDAFEEALAGFTPDPGSFAYIDPEGARFHRPRSLLELLRLRKEHAEARLLGGGMGFGASIATVSNRPMCVLSTAAVVEMGAVLDLGHAWEIGASVTLSGLSEAVGEPCEMLGQMLAGFGSRALRNRATLGGALCAPESTGEVGPALVALGATAIIAGLEREWEMPLEAFLADAPEESLRGEEVLKAIRLPRTGAEGRLRGCARVSPRRRNAPSIASLAVDLELDGEGRITTARVVTGAAWARSARAVACEAALGGQPWNGATVKRAAQALREAAPAFSNDLAGGEYRRAVTGALLQRFFHENPAEGTLVGNETEREDGGEAEIPPSAGTEDVDLGNEAGRTDPEAEIDPGEGTTQPAAADDSSSSVQVDAPAAHPSGGPVASDEEGGVVADVAGAAAEGVADAPDEAGIVWVDEGAEHIFVDVAEGANPENPSPEAADEDAVDLYPLPATGGVEWESLWIVEEAVAKEQGLEGVFVDADAREDGPEEEDGFGTIFVDPDEVAASDAATADAEGHQSTADEAPETEGGVENEGAAETTPEMRPDRLLPPGSDDARGTRAGGETEARPERGARAPSAPRTSGIYRAKLPPPRKTSLDVQPRNGVVIEKEEPAP